MGYVRTALVAAAITLSVPSCSAKYCTAIGGYDGRELVSVRVKDGRDAYEVSIRDGKVIVDMLVPEGVSVIRECIGSCSLDDVEGVFEQVEESRERRVNIPKKDLDALLSSVRKN